MKKVFVILGMLLSLGMFCACSSDDDNDKVKEWKESKEPRDKEEYALLSFSS